ncbi:Flp family type IVb pilin [Pseudomonas sp. LS-2]|jgi:pilus assembly protein Flp/PilA|uniref:Flp family type IVb pilin n=1 Tax=Pseudomonas sp. LS-2 TaxID=2315859 RepID=UPI000E72DB88|nr:Flp family type IVb pilin [Pseudomonas sp. LS-2]RJX75995.1 Flp family type IVb pilin [Pseudomonas sp. LS-2]
MFLNFLSVMIRRFVKDEEAASAIEYAIVVAMAAAVAALFMTNLATEVKRLFNALFTALNLPNIP